MGEVERLMHEEKPKNQKRGDASKERTRERLKRD